MSNFYPEISHFLEPVCRVQCTGEIGAIKYWAKNIMSSEMASSGKSVGDKYTEGSLQAEWKTKVANLRETNRALYNKKLDEMKVIFTLYPLQSIQLMFGIPFLIFLCKLKCYRSRKCEYFSRLISSRFIQQFW